jgi:hypothetical protein
MRNHLFALFVAFVLGRRDILKTMRSHVMACRDETKWFPKSVVRFLFFSVMLSYMKYSPRKWISE